MTASIDLHDQGHHEEAIAALDEAIRLDPEGATAYKKRGDSYFNLGEYENAILDLDEAVRIDPEDAEVSMAAE